MEQTQPARLLELLRARKEVTADISRARARRLAAVDHRDEDGRTHFEAMEQALYSEAAHDIAQADQTLAALNERIAQRLHLEHHHVEPRPDRWRRIRDALAGWASDTSGVTDVR